MVLFPQALSATKEFFSYDIKFTMYFMRLKVLVLMGDVAQVVDLCTTYGQRLYDDYEDDNLFKCMAKLLKENFVDLREEVRKKEAQNERWHRY